MTVSASGLQSSGSVPRRSAFVSWCAVVVIVLGCHRPRGDDGLAEAREAAALAWVNALGADDGATLARLSTDPLVFRSVGNEHPCDGHVAGGPALTAWLTCVRAKAELRHVADSWKDFRQPAQPTPESAALQRYLPHVVRGEDVWSRFVGADERARSRDALDALQKEAGSDGAWIVIAANGLSATLMLRLQIVGPAATAQVHAVLAHVTRTSD
ncbi:MAG: hypothetical protein JWM82_2050 [Myxococcales bacterium]|nr:hypothetical protein [Myxococcales bacterium]